MLIKKMVRAKSQLFGVKFPPAELKTVQEKAKKYTAGNVSAWIRYASQNYEPSKKELA